MRVEMKNRTVSSTLQASLSGSIIISINYYPFFMVLIFISRYL